MAAQRPNVIVSQEYENLTVAPDIPDLDVLVVGPCYQILDYADDKDDCYAEDYGELNSACPLVPPVAVVMAGPPTAAPGIAVDGDSVRIFFDEGRAVMVENTTAAAQAGVFVISTNLFTAHDTSAGVHLASLGVVPGDILITQSVGTSDYVMTVKEVTNTLNDTSTDLEFLLGTGAFDPVQEGDIVTLTGDIETVSRDGVYTITRVVSDREIELSGASAWVGAYEAGLLGTTTISVASPTGAIRGGYPATKALADYSNLRTTTEFAATNGASARWRVERAINDVEIDTADFSVEGNEITLATGITVNLGTAPTLLAKAVSYAKIYIEYMGLRTDLQNIGSYSSYSEIVAALGKYDARNPLCVGAVVAKANTTTPINAYGLSADTLGGYQDFINRISSVRDVYAIVPLTYSNSSLAALNIMTTSLADPTHVLNTGIKQKFRVVIGALELPVQKELVAALSGGTTTPVTGAASTVMKSFTWTQTGGAGVAPDFGTLGIIPGDLIEVETLAPAATATYTVAAVRAAGIIEVDEAITVLPDAVGDMVTITNAAGTADRLATQTWVGTTFEFTITAAALDLPYLILTAANANFITNGVVPADILQVPSTLTTSVWTTYSSYVVDEVLSETQVRVYNNGTDTSELANELPHLYRRDDGLELVDGTLYLRVVRNMSKDQQVSEMIAVASSFGSKRLLLCYPDSVDVSSLVDGSLTRTVADTPEVAAAQPGYYLSCAVGGMTAGKPPQQGFTNLGIAGIDRIYNSSEYFREEQITDLSNGGVYVFVQETTSSLPVCVHEVTTDVTALEFSEYMVIKDFDFVAWTYLDTLLPFIGEWNVLPSTVEFIRQGLITTGDVLMSQYVEKIGAPLTDYTIDDVSESSLSTDRIEAYVDVDLPMTLNTIGLHLVG